MFLTVTTSLHWPTYATVPNNVTVPACVGINVTLHWHTSGIPENKIVIVEWRYRADGGE